MLFFFSCCSSVDESIIEKNLNMECEKIGKTLYGYIYRCENNEAKCIMTRYAIDCKFQGGE